MNLKININILEKYLANLVNDFEYKKITNKLKEYDLMSDVDDQRFHHFCSWILVWGRAWKHQLIELLDHRH